MEITCPACNRSNADETHCSRCGADLTALFHIRLSADLALKDAMQELKRNDGRSALQKAEMSWHLKNSPEAARLAFLACLQLRRFPAAARWYELATQNQIERSFVINRMNNGTDTLHGSH